MTTKRKQSKAMSRAGVSYVRAVVERHNSTFQEIDLDNDLGNDAYIEFIEREAATGCCVVVQIKAGTSYVTRDGRHYLLKGDRDHFEYWESHNLPVGAIVYDPTTGVAGWCDVTEFLRAHPERVQVGPYTIPIPVEHAFDDHSFDRFRMHFLRYRERYKGDDNLGQSLAKFADIDRPEACQDGVYALFSFHRQNLSSWTYLISCFRYFRGHPLRRRLALILSLLPGHPDVFWHRDNVIEEPTRRAALSLLKKRFGCEEVAVLLETVDEAGIERGTLGQAIHALIDVIPDSQRMLEDLAFDPSLSEDARYWAILLIVYDRQWTSTSACVHLIDQYMARFPDDLNEEVLTLLRQTMRDGEPFHLY